MQVDESNQTAQERQKDTHGGDMELEGLVMESERDRLQRYSGFDFLMQVKQNAERNCEERIDSVRCASISLCGGSVFMPWDCTSCPLIWSHTWTSV